MPIFSPELVEVEWDGAGFVLLAAAALDVREPAWCDVVDAAADVFDDVVDVVEEPTSCAVVGVDAVTWIMVVVGV